MQLRIFAATYRGGRPANDDNFRASDGCPFIPPNIPSFYYEAAEPLRSTKLFAVADGCGGMAYGHLASFQAMQEVGRYAARFPPSADPDAVPDWLRGCMEAAAQAADTLNPDLKSFIGDSRACTTLSLAVITADGSVFTANIGDSPVFLQHGNSFEQLTILDNHYEAARSAGFTAAPAMRHRLTRCLGMGPAAAGAAGFHLCRHNTLDEGDTLFLCSDGVTDAFTPDALPLALRIYGLDQLVRQAGGQTVRPFWRRSGCPADNCTAVLIKAEPYQEQETEKAEREES